MEQLAKLNGVVLFLKQLIQQTIGDFIVERTVETTRTDLTRLGVNTQVIEKIEEESLGNRVLSRAVIPFVRPRTSQL